MLRRMATSVVAAITLVLSASLPALADHAEPDKTLDGIVKSCVGIVPGAYWEKTARVPEKIRHPWWKVTISDDKKSLDVALTSDGISANAQLAVLVNGKKTNTTNLFLGEPGEDLLDLFAPSESGKHSKIKKYTICKVKAKTPPDKEPPEEEPPVEEPPEEEPPAEEPPAEEPPVEETPTAEETPVPVPTSVPAGTSGSDTGLALLVLGGLVAAVLTAGATILGRRLTT